MVFPIAPTESYRETVDSRDHHGVVASLGPFFSPRGVAVYGASARAGTIGGLVFRNIVEGGFTGDAYPVNRRGEDVAGLAGYTSLAEVPGDVDLAVFCLPGEHVLEAVGDAWRRECGRSASSLRDSLRSGRKERSARRACLELVRSHGARLIGPNCLGIAVAGPRLNATFAPRAFPPGRIGFSSQSGALGLALLERSDARGLGFSASSRSATRRTSPPTTSSSTGRRIRPRRSSSSISSRSATRASSDGWRAESRAGSPYSP